MDKEKLINEVFEDCFGKGGKRQWERVHNRNLVIKKAINQTIEETQKDCADFFKGEVINWINRNEDGGYITEMGLRNLINKIWKRFKNEE